MIRLSSSTIFNTGVYNIQQQQNGVFATQQQVSSGRRITTPSDDPVASARALMVSQSDAMNTQYGTNRTAAKNTLTLAESNLQSATTLIQSIQALAVQAGSGVFTDSDRASIATQLQGDYQQLLGLANTTDGAGTYIFAGGMGTKQPFVDTPTGVNYVGDQTSQKVSISASRELQITFSGADIFQNTTSANAVPATSAFPSNTGSATINAGAVTDQTKYNAASSKNINIKFAVIGGVTTYDLVDKATGTSLLTGGASAAAGPYPGTYKSGNAISLSQSSIPAFDFGANVTITGTPANGDTFSVQSTNPKVSVFDTIKNLVTTLQTPSSAMPGSALSSALSTASQNLNNSLGTILTTRAVIGTNLQEVNTADTTGANLANQYKQALSVLQDTNYTQAISQLTQQQMSYQAAMKSFNLVQGLSLFNYM